VLPLSTLLENIAGVYVPLISGASVHLWPESSRGLSGARLADAAKMHQLLLQTNATSVILTPGLLQALVAVIKASGTGLPAMRVVAVGGALVSPQLIEAAQSLDLPVIQGYGLSECASVVSLTAAGETAVSTGRALPHVSVEIAEDGEVLVHGKVFLGYLGEPRNDPAKAWPTGELGHLDQAGQLHITGRKKNLIITDQGRNVSPEWVERSLLDQFGIDQVAVLGEARPFLIAVVTADAGLSDTQIQQSVDRANAALPDYARVGAWIRSQVAFSLANGQLSAKAEPQRAQIARDYAQTIDSIYSLKEPCYGVL
jgi:long-subunit acyl-CoA synthetase (AMP-forming)